MDKVRTPFTLTTEERITPNDGEMLGIDLAEAGHNLLKKNPTNPDIRNRAAQLFVLAAAAYDHGATASIGHNRTARYHAQRDRLLTLAQEQGAEPTEGEDRG